MIALLRLGSLSRPGCWSPAPAGGPPPAARPPAPLTILISIDGFRPDYLDRGVTPTSRRPGGRRRAARRHAAVVPVARPSPTTTPWSPACAPTATASSTTTWTTRAIPASPSRMSHAQVSHDPRWWDEAEPIWVTAERAGMRTATMFWPGSEAADPRRAAQPLEAVRQDGPGRRAGRPAAGLARRAAGRAAAVRHPLFRRRRQPPATTSGPDSAGGERRARPASTPPSAGWWRG